MIGALLDAASLEKSAPAIGDPFSGGGTVAIEAARRGLAMYAQDIHPWAVAGLASALDGVDADVLEKCAESALEKLEPIRTRLYRTPCPAHGKKSELIHIFWVRTCTCPTCGRIIYLYPYTLLTLASRKDGEREGYFGCRSCGKIGAYAVKSGGGHRCHSCGASLPAPSESLLADRMITCVDAACRKTFRIFHGEASIWKSVLVQRSCQRKGERFVHFDIPTRRESSPHSRPRKLPAALTRRIPEGIETSILRRAGFNLWSDLYPARQLTTMLAAAAAVNALDTSDDVRARLRLAVCGAAEMAGFLSRWDRYYPKAFEAMANHRYAASALVARRTCSPSWAAGRLGVVLPHRWRKRVGPVAS